MKPSVSFCPTCGYEVVDKAAFCRKCGINLGVVDRALQEVQKPVSPAVTKESPDRIVEDLKQDIFIKALRGGITVGLSLPLFLLLFFGVGPLILVGELFASQAILVAGALLLLLFFNIVGIRDLSRAYSMFKNPAASLKALKEKKERELLDAGSTMPELTSRIERREVDFADTPSSVTEHTTFQLKNQRASDSSSTNELD